MIDKCILSEKIMFVNNYLMINDKLFTNTATVDFAVVFAYNKLELLWIIMHI